MKKLFDNISLPSIQHGLPVSVGTKKEVVFVFSRVVAIAKGKNIIAEFSAVEQCGVN